MQSQSLAGRKRIWVCRAGASCCQASSGLVSWRSEAGCIQYQGIFAPHPTQLLGRWLNCRDWCVAVGKCKFVSLSYDNGRVPGVSVYPPNGQTRAGRDLSSAGLEVWFHLPWPESPSSCPPFPGLCCGEGCLEGWCVVVCRRRVPCWLWKVVVGDVWAGQGGSNRSTLQQPPSSHALPLRSCQDVACGCCPRGCGRSPGLCREQERAWAIPSGALGLNDVFSSSCQAGMGCFAARHTGPRSVSLSWG